MEKYTKQDLINLVEMNTQLQPKAKYSNAIILTMLKSLDDNFTATLEPARSAKYGVMVNRGSLVECIVKYAVIRNGEKTPGAGADLDTKHYMANLDLVDNVVSDNIEIKFSTSFAPATTIKSKKPKKVILVSEHTIGMIDSDKIIYTPAGKININNQKAKDLKPLTKLMEVLGY